ncbi:hypothetical protein FSP39_014080 [Pinctada imbricata]|uniref:G-protein coupled receptors family 1 profile domain-containing protein n=1 Tax=Pinctada imbricata TaxID=66713 RepID=A0AA88XWW6_PINIB|nr:hypothetical protein FSP39_014080 [Pinctada imbricata]
MNTTESSLLNSTVACLENCTTTINIIDDKTTAIANHIVIVVLNYVNYVLLPVFLVLGLTGNTLTIMVMNNKKFVNQTSTLFLTALSLSDTVLLLTQPFNKVFVMKLFGLDLRALSNIGCKIFFIIFKTSKMTSSWFLVLLCFERFVAVWFPLKAKTICTRRYAFIAIAAVYLVIGSYTSIWSYASNIDEKGICHPDQYDKSDPVEVQKFGRFIIGGVSLYSLIPTTILLTLTPLIVVQLFRRAKMFGKMSSQSKKKQSDTNKTTVMLVGVMFAYVILILPVTGLHLFAFIFRLNAFGSGSLGWAIYREVSQILEQINYCINFFLYVLSSSLFRGALNDLLCFKKLRTLKRSTHLGSSIRRNNSEKIKTNLTGTESNEKTIENEGPAKEDDGQKF